MNTLLKLVLIALLSSCTMLINMDDNSDKIVLRPNESQNFCAKNQFNKNSVISSNKFANKLFLKLINEDNEFKNLSFIEKSVAWSLIQMNIRPDASSPAAQFQAIIKLNSKSNYIFVTGKEGLPFLQGLNKILKDYKSKRSLKQIARIVYNKTPNSFIIDTKLSNFLKINQEQLKRNKYYKKKFL